MLNFKSFSNFNFINNVVLGGAGFIGSHLIDVLLKKGESVLCVDNLSTGKFDNIIHQTISEKFEFVNHDITKPFISDIPIEKIWHLACPASPNIYQDDPLNTLRVNYEGTLNALKLAKDNSSKILFTSTSEVYGNTKNNTQFETMPIFLSTSSPRACYSEGKRLAETLIHSFHRIYNLEIRIARVFNTYGPRVFYKDGRVISNFINQCLNTENLSIYGDGLQTRSFCYVDDLIEGLLKLMDSNYIYPINIGNSEEIKIIDLATLIKEKINPSLNFLYLELPKDDPKFRKPSLENAQKFLNWQPKISLSQGLDNTIIFYKNLVKKNNK